MSSAICFAMQLCSFVKGVSVGMLCCQVASLTQQLKELQTEQEEQDG